MRHRRSCTPRRGHRSCIGQSCSDMPASCLSRTSPSWSTWDAGWQKQVNLLQVYTCGKANRTLLLMPVLLLGQGIM